MAVVRIAALDDGASGRRRVLKVRPAHAFVGFTDTIRFMNLTGVPIVTNIRSRNDEFLGPCESLEFRARALTCRAPAYDDPVRQARVWRWAYVVFERDDKKPDKRGRQIPGESSPEIIIDEEA